MTDNSVGCRESDDMWDEVIAVWGCRECDGDMGQNEVTDNSVGCSECGSDMGVVCGTLFRFLFTAHTTVDYSCDSRGTEIIKEQRQTVHGAVSLATETHSTWCCKSDYRDTQYMVL